MEQQDQTDEGSRSFAYIIQHVADGEAHREASAVLQELIKTISDRARLSNSDASGEMTVKFKLTVDPRGVADVVYDVSSKLPRVKKVASTMWVTRGGNLSVDSPRQTRLPLMDVSAPTNEVRNIDPETGEVRSI